MQSHFKIIQLSGLFIIGLLLFSACSSNDEAQTNKNNDASEENDNTYNNQTNATDEIEVDEADIPPSEISTSKITLNSTFFKSTLDFDSSIEKEIVETLTEFDAVDTEKGTILTLPEDILFDFGSADLRSSANETIEQLVQAIETTDKKVTIIGHTDSKGSKEHNQTLSEDRAKAVVDALKDEGVKENRLVAEGQGEENPVAANEKSDGSDNPDGRQKNRRVEVLIEDFGE